MIASKSPVGISGIKQSINFSRDHTVEEGLHHIALMNSALLQTTDMQTAIMAGMSKEKAEFPKL
jgi:delta(3,5)-delta(2,4)-dienoyl-CoA isomerase